MSNEVVQQQQEEDAEQDDTAPNVEEGQPTAEQQEEEGPQAVQQAAQPVQCVLSECRRVLGQGHKQRMQDQSDDWIRPLFKDCNKGMAMAVVHRMKFRALNAARATTQCCTHTA